VPGTRAGPNKPTKVLVSTEGFQRSTWGGNPSNPYDTTRAASLGSSSGSAVSVEHEPGDVRHLRGDARLLPRPGQPQFSGPDPAAQVADRVSTAAPSDRTSTTIAPAFTAAASPTPPRCSTRCAIPVDGYYDPRDIFTTVARSSILSKPYAASAATPGTPGSLKGMRIGIIRESMLTFPGVKADEPIVEAAIKEIKEVLGKQLGATLVESIDPRFPTIPRSRT